MSSVSKSLDKYRIGVVPFTEYRRAADVLDYAYDRDIPLGQAIVELINSGLSHQ